MIMATSDDHAEPEFLQPRVRHDGPIILAEPDPTWPDRYGREESRIRDALGSRALQIEHVGSTSVPGLCAKPLIDVVLAVADSADEAAYVADLEGAGYELHVREPTWQEHRFFRDRHRQSQIHVFTLGSAEIRRMLTFRDRLRSHPDERELYARTKRELAARRWDYVQDYADAKSEVVEGIITRGLTAE